MKRRNVQDVDESIVVAEGLMDIQRDTPARKPSWGERPITRPPQKDDKLNARPSTLKGKAIEGVPEGRLNVIYVTALI